MHHALDECLEGENICERMMCEFLYELFSVKKQKHDKMLLPETYLHSRVQKTRIAQIIETNSPPCRVKNMV